MTPKQITFKKWRLKNLESEKIRWKKYYLANKEKLKGSWRLYDETHKEERRNRTLKRGYGITIEDYARMFKKQNGCCAICSVPQEKFSRVLAVDHDHTTKKVRGLLCGRCNLGLAFLENREWNRLAHSYLEVYFYHA